MTRPYRDGMIVLLLLTFMTLAIASPSPAASTRKLCASRANMYDSPGGFVVGRLYRPARVRVLRRSANRRWASVRASTGITGWVTAGALCRG
jgi:hypothetical protein